MKIIFIVFSLFITSTTFANVGRLSLSAGASQLTYNETHALQPSLDKSITQVSANFELDAMYFLFPNWFFVGTGVDYIGPTISASGNDSASFLNQRTSIGFYIPARPMNLIILSEFVYDSMTPSSSEFGYETMSFARYSAVLDYVTKSGITHISLKYPFFSGIKGRSEYFADLTFHMSGNQAAGSFVKFYYSSLEVKIPGSREIQISNKSMGLKFGYSW